MIAVPSRHLIFIPSHQITLSYTQIHKPTYRIGMFDQTHGVFFSILSMIFAEGGNSSLTMIDNSVVYLRLFSRYGFLCLCLYLCVSMSMSLCLCFYVYVPMSMSLYLCIYTYVSMPMSLCICLYFYVYVSMSKYLYLCLYAYVSMSMSMSLCICLYFYVYVSMSKYLYLCIYAYVSTSMSISTSLCLRRENFTGRVYFFTQISTTIV